MNGRAHKRAVYDGECARLVDPLTGNIIYNAAEVDRDVAANIAAFEETYGVQFHEHTLTKTQKAIKCTGHNSVAPAYIGTGCGKDLYFDEMPSAQRQADPPDHGGDARICHESCLYFGYG